MKNDRPLRFRYRLSAGNLILMAVAAIAVTASMGYLAQINPDVRLTRTLARMLSPSAPPMIYWGLTTLGCLATLYVFFAAIKMSNAVNYVELGPTGAFVPSASISMSPITIPYRSIRNIQVIDVQKHQMAVISSSVGEARLGSQCFSTPRDFTAFLLALEQRRHG